MADGSLVEEKFDEAMWQHFPVSSSTGERISHIAVSRDVKAFKLFTNEGRECYWGEMERGMWTDLRPQQGEVVAGLALCFGETAGNYNAYQGEFYGPGTAHARVNGVGLLTRQEGGGEKDAMEDVENVALKRLGMWLVQEVVWLIVGFMVILGVLLKELDMNNA
jgi:hypothetical protein